MVHFVSNVRVKQFSFGILFLFLGLTLVSAQEQDYFFKRLRVDDGLSHNKVNCVLQDKRGFLWFGTEDGLNRYDGRFFTIFRSDPRVTSTISGNIINDLYEDGSGVIWIATRDGGISSYDYRLPKEKQFKQFKHDENSASSIPENNIKKIVGDKWGNLWLASARSHVLRFNIKSRKFDTPVKVGTKGILSLTIDHNDTLWVGREGGGLLKVDTRTLRYDDDKRYRNLYGKLPHASITAIFEDSQQNIWCGSWDNDLFCFEGAKQTEISYSKGEDGSTFMQDEIVSFAEDADNRIWMAGAKLGLDVFDTHKKKFLHFRNNQFNGGSLVDDHVNTVYIDKKGTIWIGTNNGLSIYNPLFYPFKKHFLDSPKKDLTIYDFYKDHEGKLWIGTSEGLYIKHPENNKYEFRSVIFKGKKLTITKFFIDVDDSFYLGTDYTLFKYDAKLNQVKPLENTDEDPVMKKLISSRIVSIIRDTINQHPVLVVSPYGHYLAYYDLKDRKWFSRTDPLNIIKSYGIKDHLIQKFYRDDTGIWIANSSFGLGFWRPGKQHDTDAINYYENNPSNSFSISNNHVYDILNAGKNRLWISTYGGGLNLYNKETRKFSHVAYSSNLTEGIEDDDKGNIWMVCNGHLHKYEPLEDVYSCYDLPSLQKSNGLKGYIYKDKENNLFAAGDNYYVTFKPDAVEKVDYSPKVYLTDFRIFNESFSHLLEEDIIRLNHEQNYFSFTFSAPDFSGDNVQYAYMLKGFDKDWIDAGKANTSTYSNLPGGEYQFLVQARNWKGDQMVPYKSVNITIIPPFWNRWWFYLLLASSPFIIAFIVYRYRMSIRERHSVIRNGIARDLHDQVGSTLGSIAVYSEVAKIYHEQKDANQLTDVLKKITEAANEMINEMGDIVWALNPKNDHFSNILQRIKAYAQPICTAKQINFNLTCDSKLLQIVLNTKVRKNLFLIVREAIHNAIKYANCTNLDVDIKYANHLISIRVSDNGIGFDQDIIAKEQESNLSGNGLANMEFRAKELNGIFIINSKEGIGTVISFTMRVNP